MVPINRQHDQINHVRQPEGTNFTMANYNAKRQSQLLDEWREDASREGEEGAGVEKISKNFQLGINVCLVDVRVDTNFLRRTLGFPLYDIFDG